MRIRDWFKRNSAHVVDLQATGPQFDCKAIPDAVRGYQWHGTINGRVVTSMGLPTQDAAVEAATAIYAENVRPGLPDPYADPAWLVGTR